MSHIRYSSSFVISTIIYIAIIAIYFNLIDRPKPIQKPKEHRIKIAILTPPTPKIEPKPIIKPTITPPPIVVAPKPKRKIKKTIKKHKTKKIIKPKKVIKKQKIKPKHKIKKVIKKQKIKPKHKIKKVIKKTKIKPKHKIKKVIKKTKIKPKHKIKKVIKKTKIKPQYKINKVIKKTKIKPKYKIKKVIKKTKIKPKHKIKKVIKKTKIKPQYKINKVIKKTKIKPKHKIKKVIKKRVEQPKIVEEVIKTYTEPLIEKTPLPIPTQIKTITNPKPIKIVTPHIVKPPKENLNAKKSNFLENVRAKIYSNKRYPTLAKRRHIQGRVHVVFDILANGEVTNIRIDDTSKILKKEVRRSIRKSFPIDIPSSIASMFPMRNISVNIDFRLQ